GTPFMANATPAYISTLRTTPIGYVGNLTYELYEYQVPVLPNSNYLTIIYNSSDYFDNTGDTPGTYYVFPAEHMVTFFDLSGYTYVDVSLDEPSPQLGQPVPVNIQAIENNNSVSVSSSHLIIRYLSYGSTNYSTISTYGLSVNLPYGSTASFYLYNGWNQQIGSISNVSILSLNPSVYVPVHLSVLSFDFLNSSQEPVSLTSNGITISGFFGSAQVAIGYSYIWSTSVFDPYSGRNVNYTGSVLITSPQQVLKISTQAPASSLTVYVNSYAPSQQGQLGAPGEPPVILTIDGTPQTPGETYIGFVGSTYQIKVTDVLGQLLYENNVTLEVTNDYFYANITVPSWQLSIQNEEQVPATSPLAIEYVSIKNAEGMEYNFTNDIGQQSVLYLKQGNYTIHAYDNATFTRNISLDGNQNYVIFGQDLLNTTTFLKEINALLNNTQSLQVHTVSAPTIAVPSEPLSFEFSLYYANGTELSHSALLSTTFLGQVSNSSSASVISVAHSFSVSGNVVYFNFSAPPVGQYTILINALKGNIEGSISYSLDVQTTSESAIVIIEYYPQNALFGEFGVNLQFSQFITYFNGKEIYTPVQQANISQVVVINTTTIYGTLISSYKVRISEQTQFVEIPLNIVPITIDNMNSSYVIGIRVSANHITQPAQYIMPLQSQVFYVPAGTYNFSFSYNTFTTFQIVKYLNTTITVSGVSYFVITGITLAELNYHLQQTQANITNLVEDVNISLGNSYSKVYNETLVINADITNTNSSVIKEVLNENNTINNIHSLVQQIQSDVSVIQNNILSQINSTALNITTKETTIKDLVSLSLQEENATFSYQLKFGTPSVSGTTYQFPVFVSLFNGQTANLSVTQQAAKNLRMIYISGNDSTQLQYSVSNIQAGSFVVDIYNITAPMVQNISENKAIIASEGNVTEGNRTSLVSGLIGSSQIHYVAILGELFVPVFYGLNLWWLLAFFVAVMGAIIFTYRYKYRYRKHVTYSLYVFTWYILIILYLMHLHGMI
ncbi:MAG: hypothetical protein QXV17_15155, partial [Candidatus Micrarchaeaceae archaeon]